MSAVVTRKPTGKPAWPMILLAGVEKSGKTYAAAEASGSDMVGRTFWLTCGEDDPDEYAPLGRFEIVEQAGTHRSLVESIRAITAETAADKRPALIVLDSMSMLWQMLTDEAQQAANRRRKRDEAPITPDLWNSAAKRWRAVMNALRTHPGPVVLTARLALVMEMEGEKPTGEKYWKVEGHKTLPYDVTAVVQMRARGDVYLTGVRSIRWVEAPDATVPFPDFTVEALWKKLGLSEATDRAHNHADGATSLADDDATRTALLQRLAAVADMTKIDAFWQSQHAEPIAAASDIDALRALTEQGEARAAERAKQPDPEPTLTEGAAA